MKLTESRVPHKVDGKNTKAFPGATQPPSPSAYTHWKTPQISYALDMVVFICLLHFKSIK